MITYPPDIAFFALSVERLHGVSAGDTACGSDALPPSSLALIVAPLSLARCSLQSTVPNLGADYDW